MEVAYLDLFSQQARTYASIRPRYPRELFAFIASLAPRRELAWDCATGNGQAAQDLASQFERVVATDASEAQIAQAVAVSNVEYRVANASDSGLVAQSVDAVTVAQALHWLDIPQFAAEVRRVTVSGGVVAAWCYGACNAGEDVESLLREFQDGTLGPYWHPARRWVDEGYRTIAFPFKELASQAFELRARWSLSQLREYLNSWSAVATFRRERGEDPVAPLMEQLDKYWKPADGTRDITWPIGLRIGRV
jgi:ubiquinone/menaquinone biosynthesis C-methylase UbiE